MGPRWLSATTVRQLHAIISATCEQGYRWGWLAENPTKRAKPPTVERKQVKAMSGGKFRALLEVCEKQDPALGTAVALAKVAGARRGELCALRWADIDLKAGTMRAERSIANVAGAVHGGGGGNQDAPGARDRLG